MAAVSGAAIAIYALVTAAVAASAATAISASQGSYAEGGANDAFGDWLKTFFIGFAGGAVGGAAGGAGQAAEGGMSAADVMAAEQVGSAAQLGNVGANTAAGVANAGAETAAMTTQELAMTNAELAAAEQAGLGSFGEQAGLALPNTTGQNAPGLFDSVSSLTDFSPSKELFKLLGGSEEQFVSFDEANQWSDAVSEFSNLMEGGGQHEQVNPMLEQQAASLTGASPFGGFGWRQQQAKNQFDYFLNEQQSLLDQDSSELAGELFGGGDYDF